MPANRIFYATHSLGITRDGNSTPSASEYVHGVQSVGITTNFNLEQIYELGQLELYENIENIPNIEVTAQKVFDGYPHIYQLATRGATTATLTGRSTPKCGIILNTFIDSQDNASGVPMAKCFSSGMYVNSLNYQFPVEGNCTESVTLVGNNKTWAITGLSAVASVFTGSDQPASMGISGGVQRRENILFAAVTAAGPTGTDVNGQVDTIAFSVLPPDIDGITSSGTNEKTNGNYGAHLQSVSISCDLGRPELFELGRRGPYFRFVQFPVQVTCEISTLATQYDKVSATEDGVLTGDNAGNNLTNRTIKIRLHDSTLLNLGTKNKLSSVSFSGGDTGGGNVTCTYTFNNFNSLTVQSSYDPSDGTSSTTDLRIAVP